MATQLPLELLALICDLVAEDAQDSKDAATTLRNCALVSSRLTAHCQNHLFSNIRIPFHKPRTIPNLQQVLDIDHPELGLYVKSLSVIFRSVDDGSRPGLDRILGRCTQVTSLTIGCDQSFFFNIDWEVDVAQSTRLALESIIYSPMCKTLDFFALRMPFSIFSSSCRNSALESLSFSKRGTAVHELAAPLVNIPEQGPSYSSLRFLSILPSLIPAVLSARFQDGRYLFDLTNLGTLWVDNTRSREQPDVMAQMLNRVPRLRSLGLKLRSYYTTPTRNIFNETAPCFSTTLTELRITLESQWIFVSSLPNSDPFAGVLHGLQAISGRNILRNICIRVDLDQMWLEGKIARESWLCGATSFRVPGSFPHLKELTLDVTTVNMLLSPEEVQEHGLMSGEQLVEDLLDIPFCALDLPYKFNFRARSL